MAKAVAEANAFDLKYSSTVNWLTYSRLIKLANIVGETIRSNPLLQPRDMIDIQSFMWVTTSETYFNEITKMRNSNE